MTRQLYFESRPGLYIVHLHSLTPRYLIYLTTILRPEDGPIGGRINCYGVYTIVEMRAIYEVYYRLGGERVARD